MKQYRCPQCHRIYTPFEALHARMRCPQCGAPLVEDAVMGRPGAPAPRPRNPNPENSLTEKKAATSAPRVEGTPKPRPRAAVQTGAPLLGTGLPTDGSDNGNGHRPRQDGGALPISRGPNVVLEIRPPQEGGEDLDALTQLIAALSLPIVLEFAGAGKQRRIIVRCRREDVEVVRSVLAAVYGSPEVLEMSPEEDPAAVLARTRSQQEVVLGLDKPEALPLRTWRTMEESDPVLPLLAALGDLQEGEAVLVQWVVAEAAPRNWNEHFQRELLLQRRRGMGALPPMLHLLRVMALIVGALFLLGYFAVGDWLKGLPLALFGFGGVLWGLKAVQRSEIDWERTGEEVVAEKLDQVAYRVLVRIVSGARTDRRAASLAGRVERAFSAFRREQGNALVARRRGPLRRPPIDIAAALRSHKAHWSLLGDKEIVTMWHLPIRRAPDLFPVAQESHRVPHAELFARQHSDDFHLGTVRRENLPFFLGMDALGRSHALIVGRTRMGKSALQARIAAHLAASDGRGMIVLDPHDALATTLLQMLPPGRLEEVEWLDFGGLFGWIPGYNPYDVTMFGGDPYRTFMAFADEAHQVFSDFWGPRMAMAFSSVSLAMVLANAYRAPEEQFGIPDALDLLITNQVGGPQDLRIEALLRMLPAREDMTGIERASRDAVLAFFTSMGDLNPSLEQQVRLPVVSKFHEFLATREGRMVFSSPRSTFDLQGAIQAGKIVIITTGTRLSENLSRFVGSLMLSTIAQHVKVLGNDHPPLTVIVDEAQTFGRARLGAYMAELGKWGVNFIVASQGRKLLGAKVSSALQGESDLFDQMVTNADVLMVFRTGGDEARYFAREEFGDGGDITPQTLLNLRKYSAVVRAPRGMDVIPPTLVDLLPPKTPYPENLEMLKEEHFLRRAMRREEEAERIAEEVSRRSAEYLQGGVVESPGEGGVLSSLLTSGLPPDVQEAIQQIGAGAKPGQGNAPSSEGLENILGDIFGDFRGEG